MFVKQKIYIPYKYVLLCIFFMLLFQTCTFITYFLCLVIATVALAFLLLPMCQYIINPCSDGNK